MPPEITSRSPIKDRVRVLSFHSDRTTVNMIFWVLLVQIDIITFSRVFVLVRLDKNSNLRSDSIFRFAR